MSYLPSSRRIAQVALPVVLCAAVATGVARANSGAVAPPDTALPLTLVQADPPPPGAPPRPDDMPPPPPPGHGDMHGDGHFGFWHHGFGDHRDGDNHDGDNHDGDNHDGDHHGGPAMHGLMLAAKLAALHVYLDITPQQEDAWHGFSQAVLALAPPPAPPLPTPDARPPGAFDAIDHFAKRMQQRADAAQAMDAAAQKLKSVLTAPQIAKADAVVAAMHEHGMHHFWHHDDEHRPDHDDHR